jgi:predicted nucleotidyltransferase
MFTVEDREHIQAYLISLAESDERITAAALVGSSATGVQDALSDIDLALQIASTADIDTVIDHWTQLVRERVDIAHTLDVIAGNGVLYRVFLTRDSMQIDISFWSHDEFRATGDRFHLLFGTANEPASPPPLDADRIIGTAWLYALHVRSAIARSEPWHAQSLLDDMRDFVLTLACLRHAANAYQMRGVDSLPSTLLLQFIRARSATLEMHELQRSLTMHVELLMDEVSAVDAGLASSLAAPLQLLKVSPGNL